MENRQTSIEMATPVSNQELAFPPVSYQDFLLFHIDPNLPQNSFYWIPPNKCLLISINSKKIGNESGHDDDDDDNDDDDDDDDDVDEYVEI